MAERDDLITGDIQTTEVIKEFVSIYTRDHPELNTLLVTCSVLRWFTEKLIAFLLPPEQAAQAPAMCRLLKGLPFCEESPVRGHVMSDLLRNYFLGLDEVKNQQASLRRRAAEAYRRLLDELPLDAQARFTDPLWKILAAEWLFQLSWVEPEEALRQFSLITAQSFAVLVENRQEVEFCKELYQRIQFKQVEWPQGAQTMQQLARFPEQFDILLGNNDARAVDFLDELAETPGLTNEEKASIYQWAGTACFRDAGYSQKARERLEKAYQLAPNDIVINSELAAFHTWMGPQWGRMDLARFHAKKVIDLYPELARGYEEMGNIFQRESNWDGAIRWYERARQVDTSSVDAVLGLSEIYAARRRPAPRLEPAPQNQTDGMDDTARALQLIDQAEEISSVIHYYALLRKGNALRDAARYEEAQAIYEDLCKEAPDRPDAYLELGRLHLTLLQVVQTEQAFREAWRIDPSNSAAPYELAVLYDRWGKLQRAAETCIQAGKEGITSLGIASELADVYAQQDEWSAMEQAWQDWLDIDPGCQYIAWCSMGDTYLDRSWQRRFTKDRDEYTRRTREQFSRAAALDPCLPWAHAGLANLALYQGDTQTLEHERKLVEENASWAVYDLLVRLGLACTIKGDYSQSEGYLKEAIGMEEHRTEAWLALADLYATQEREADLRATWEKIEQLDQSQKYPARMALGGYYSDQGNYEQAQQEFEQAAKLQPRMPVPYAQMSAICREQQDPVGTLAYLEQAAELSSYYAPWVEVELSRNLLRTGQFGQSEVRARTALSIEPEYLDAFIALAELGIASGDERLVSEARERLGEVRPDLLTDLEFAVAERYRKDKQGKKARQSYLHCIRDASRPEQQAQSYLGLTYLSVQRHRFKAAQTTFDQASELMPPANRYTACLSVGKEYELAGLGKEAERLYRVAIDTFPQQPVAYLYLASVLRSLSGPDAARQEYERVMQLLKASYLDLGQYYEAQQLWEDALDCYHLGMKSGPKEERALMHYRAGQLHLRNQAEDLAHKDFIRAIRLAPEHPEPYEAIMDLLIGKGKINDAHLLCKQMALQEELSSYAYLAFSRLLIQHKRFSTAVKAYKQAFKKDPAARENAFPLVDEFYNYEQYDEATDLCRDIARQPSMAFTAHLSAARILLTKVQENDTDLDAQATVDAAGVEARTAVNLEPDNPQGYLALAQISYWQHRIKDTEQAILKALALAPDLPEANSMLADLRKEQDLVEEAVAGYCKAGDLHTDRALKAQFYVKAADLLLEQPMPEEAASTLQKAVQLDPANDLAWYLLGSAYEAMEKWKEAAGVYGTSIEINPKYGDAYVALGRIYGKLRDSRKVNQLAKKLLQLDLDAEEQFIARLTIAVSYAEANARKRAETAFRELIASSPDQAEPYRRLAYWLITWKKTPLAEQLLVEMAQQPELHYEASLLQAALQQELNNMAEAERIYREVIEAYPDEEDVYNLLAQMLVEQDRFEDAQQVIQMLAAQPGQELGAYIQLGNLLIQSEKYPEAEEALRKVIEIAPVEPDGYLALANFYLERGRYPEAEQVLEEVSAGQRNTVDWHSLMIQACNGQFMVDRAIQLSKEAARLSGDMKTISVLLGEAGRLYNQKQDYTSALEVLEEARQADPQSDGVWYNLGIAHERLGHLEQAVECYNKAVELNSAYTDAYLSLGRVYGRLNQIQNVHLIARKISQMEMTSDEAYQAHLVIALAYKAGKYIEWAIEELKKAIELDPHQQDAYLWLGQIYYQQFRLATARETFEKASAASASAAGGEDGRALGWIAQCYLKEVEDLDPADPARVKKEQQAEELLRRALKTSSDEGIVHNLLASLYTRQGRLEEAVEIYRLESEAVPESFSSAYLSIATLRRRQGDQEALREDCTKALEPEPVFNSPTYLDQLRRKGLAQYLLDDYTAAEETLKKALEGNSQDYLAHFYYALNCLCLNKQEEAREHAQTGISLIEDELSGPIDKVESYRYPLEEAQALAQRQPEVYGAKEMLAVIEAAWQKQREKERRMRQAYA